ncbi:hypothetical protein [Vibrio breoganii]|uniref:hypothetical protein n=1 Tax=Vibrio breoganii TaxID=553239 RepID=UPI000C8636EE|nr:hypothetical protein [Vibrio breoganii]PMM26355.1 hypothetical protein BCT59_02620 [Vibrio breoganii]
MFTYQYVGGLHLANPMTDEQLASYRRDVKKAMDDAFSQPLRRPIEGAIRNGKERPSTNQRIKPNVYELYDLYD